jgi:predicted transcriptional regulator
MIWMVAWDMDGNDDIEDVWVKIDGGDWLNATYNHTNGEGQWWYYEWDTTTVDDGWHHISALVFDGIDYGDDLIEIFVDNVLENNPPGIEIVEPGHGDTVSGTIIIWMVAWDLDGNDDIQDVWVKIDDGDLQNATYNHTNGEGQWWYYEWDTTTVDDGWHAVWAIVFDGIDDGHDVIEVTVDNSPENHPPNVEIMDPENGETVFGVIEIWLRAWDADGKEDVEAVFVKIDDGGWHEATFVEYEGDYSWWVFEWDTTTVENGEHHIFAIAWDGEEHSDTDVIYVIVENEEGNHAPGIEIVEPGDGDTVSGLIEILMVAWDPDGPDDIEGVWVKIDSGVWHEATFLEIDGEGSWWVFEWDTTTVSDGWHHIYAKTTDGELWADDHVEVYVNNEVENHPPYIEIMEPEDGDTVSGIVEIWMVAWDADGLDDIENVWVKFDDGPLLEATFSHINGDGSWWYYEWDTTTMDDGWHVIHAIVFDGIDDGHDAIEVYVENEEENSPPHVDIIEPENGETVHGVIEIWVRAWDADGREDVEAVYIKIDSGAWHEATFVEYDGDYSWWVFEWDTTTVDDGWHLISAKAWDGLSYSGIYMIEVLVDNEETNSPPNVEIIEPGNGETVSGIIEVWLKATDLDGREDVEAVFVKIDDGGWHEATLVEYEGDFHSWWVFEWDTTTVANGEHHIYAKAWDGEEHSDTDVIYVIVENEEGNHAPEIEITAPLHGETVSGTVTVWMIAWDADGLDDIEDVWVKIDGGDLRNATYHETTGEGQIWYYEWNTTEVDDGWHWIKAIVFDGEEDGHDIIEIIVNNTPENSPPVVEITDPEHGDTVSGVIDILLRASDPDGVLDVEMVYVRIDGGAWEEATFIEYEGDYSYWVFEWDTSEVEDGEHHIYARAWDGEEHSEEDVVMVMVDNEEGGEPWMAGFLPLLILGGILGGVALVLGGTEIGTMAFMSLIFLPLYTRLSKKDVLDHFVRGQIFGYIKIHPGDNYTTIKKNLELNNGTLTYHLNVLEKEELIKSWSNGSHKYFYPLGVKIPGNGVKNPSIYDAILKSIKDSPGISVSDIAAVNGISKQLANYHVRKMAAEGTIELERKSFSKLCYPIEGN